MKKKVALITGVTGQDGAYLSEFLLKKGDKEVRNTHINIGTGKDVSIKELAETIKGIVDFKGGLIFNTEKPDGTMRKLTDVSKLNELGWEHTVSLEEGVIKYMIGT